MSKKAEYEVIAAQYYIEMQMSAAQIAKRLNLSEKTIFNWKKGGDWDGKRKNYLKSQYSTNQTLYELVHLVSKKALEDFKTEGIMPDQKTCYFIMSMADKLIKLKNFENQAAQEKVEEVSEKSATGSAKEEILKDIFKEFIGG